MRSKLNGFVPHSQHLNAGIVIELLRSVVVVKAGGARRIEEGSEQLLRWEGARCLSLPHFFSVLLLPRLELSDTNVYGPYTRARTRGVRLFSS